MLRQVDVGSFNVMNLQSNDHDSLNEQFKEA